MLNTKMPVIFGNEIKDVFIKQFSDVRYSISCDKDRFKMIAVEIPGFGKDIFSIVVENIVTGESTGACLDLRKTFGYESPTFPDVLVRHQMQLSEREALLITAALFEIFEKCYIASF